MVQMEKKEGENQMRTDKEVIKLLQKKKENFLKYEEETKKLTANGEDAVEQITSALAKRQELIGIIDGIDAKIRKLCEDTEEGVLLLDASRNRCEYQRLSPSYQEVYQAGQQVFQIIARIQNEDRLAVASMEHVKNRFQRDIRQNQKVSKFSGYLKSMDYGEDVKKGFLYNEKR